MTAFALFSAISVVICLVLGHESHSGDRLASPERWMNARDWLHAFRFSSLHPFEGKSSAVTISCLVSTGGATNMTCHWTNACAWDVFAAVFRAFRS